MTCCLAWMRSHSWVEWAWLALVKWDFPSMETDLCWHHFHGKYKGKCIWTTSWKWSSDQLPVSLKKNKLSEYPSPKRLQDEYEQEWQAWIQIGWLIPYPEDELGPLRGLIPLIAILQENKQGSSCHGLSWAQWTCWCVYSWHGRLCAQIERVVAAGVRCCCVVPAPGLLTNTHWKVTVVVFNWKSRGPDIALLDWDLVSTWFRTSWQQSWMRSEHRMRTAKRQHHPTLMTFWG